MEPGLRGQVAVDFAPRRDPNDHVDPPADARLTGEAHPGSTREMQSLVALDGAETLGTRGDVHGTQPARGNPATRGGHVLPGRLQQLEEIHSFSRHEDEIGSRDSDGCHGDQGVERSSVNVFGSSTNRSFGSPSSITATPTTIAFSIPSGSEIPTRRETSEDRSGS